MNNEFLSIIESLEREKGISREILFTAIEQALISAARKILNISKENIEVSVDRETGRIKVLSDGKPVKSEEFGRISAQTAKQVIIQKIREAERDVIYEEYLAKQHSITNGLVHRFEKGNIIVDLGKTEAVLPKSEQVAKERYKQGDRIRAYIQEVAKTPHGYQIILSRRAPEFVKKLFELEVPEILEGIVEVRGIARDPGERTKMAVYSKDEKIDPVGSCVGMRGTRVKDIVRELHGERIDVIKWADKVDTYLRNALHPVEIKKMSMDKEAKKIEIIVKDDQLSMGIGKHGQNIRLSSKLIGWDVDIRGETENAAVVTGEESAIAEVPAGEEAAMEGRENPATEIASDISHIKGAGKKTQKVLVDAGFDTIAKIASAAPEDLIKLEGIGEKGAEKMINSAKELMENN